ncbi:MAG: monovalent cation/H+ antiporter complex subunit F [Limisphaerales bacterium]
MIESVLSLAFGVLTLAILLGLYRLARGPSVLDRVLAFDLINTCAVGMVVLLSIRWNTALYLELILVISLLGFLTTVAFVFYLHQTVEPGTSDPAKPPPPSPKQ